MNPGRPRLLAGYYLATPVFAVSDLVLGVPVRLAEIVPPATRAGYYLAAFALGVLVARYPRVGPWVGMGEGATNLLILLLSILLPIWSLADGSGGGSGPVQVGLDGPAALNALLSGGAIVLGFHRSQRAAMGGPAPAAGRSLWWRRL